MSTVRLRRLTADYEKLYDYVERHRRLKLLDAVGDPPERYQIEYRIASLRQVDGELQTVKSHRIEITLPRNYPRTAPQCRMLTPIFHPNIAPHAICVGDHWSAGEPLWSIVARIGEMIAYQSYNVKSPLNGEAARWALEHEDELPLDSVVMILDEATPDEPGDDSADEPTRPVAAQATAQMPRPAASPIAAPPRPPAARPSVPRPPAPPVQSASLPMAEVVAAAEVEADKLTVTCPTCGSRYRVSTAMAGRRARCRKCQGLMPIPPLG
jgi:ubiquitin-protein ligase